MAEIARRDYAEMYGPTVGDRVRLADTGLVVEVEDDCTLRAGGYGEEVTFGRGCTLRDGMGQSQAVVGPGHHEAHDLVVTNALIVDHWGIVKADIGIKGSRIAVIGKAGNPDTQPGVDIVIGPGTEIVAAEGLIVTAGGVDTQARFIGPRQIEEALRSGITTMLGGGTGATGGCTPGPGNIHRMLMAAEAFAMNLGFMGKGNASRPEPLTQQIAAGAVGLALHEEWGSTPAAIDNALTLAEVTDTQVSLGIDTLGESGFVEDAIAALRGRSVHSLHGENGGHAPDIVKLVGESNVLPGSSHAARGEAIASLDMLHDLGAIAIFGSGAQAAGGAGGVIVRTWQTAHRMKGQRGTLAGDTARHDNLRVKRYIAKYTINPALAHGIAHEVGSVEVGKWADLVLWRPACFGVKPSLVLKGGFIAAAPQPVHDLHDFHHGPRFAGNGRLLQATSLSFVSRSALDAELGEQLGLKKRLAAVGGCRTVSKHDMVHNAYTPRMEVDACTGAVRADGLLLACDAATVLPLAQRYFLF